MTLKLWAVGVDNPDPSTWSPWAEVALVVAETAEEAVSLADAADQNAAVVEVDMTKPQLLVKMPEPAWGEDL